MFCICKENICEQNISGKVVPNTITLKPLSAITFYD